VLQRGLLVLSFFPLASRFYLRGADTTCKRLVGEKLA
jgi:hypothetical protein